MIRIDRQYITNERTRPALRKAKAALYSGIKPQWIVAHWTANTNKGADAQANRNYFNNGAPGPGGTFREASAHYCVDDHAVIQCLPDTEVGFHIGGTSYTDLGKRMKPRPNLSPNYAGAIGFEMCVNSDGNWPATYAESALLAATLLLKYGLPIQRLIRHYDVTRKDCPKMMVQNEAWEKFKVAVVNAWTQLKLNGCVPALVTADSLNVRNGITTDAKIAYVLDKWEIILTDMKPVAGSSWVAIGAGQFVNSKYLKVL